MKKSRSNDGFGASHLSGKGLENFLFPPRLARQQIGNPRGFIRGVYLIYGRGAARAEDAQRTPIQSHIPPNILAYEDDETLRPEETCAVGPRPD